jgi:uncharacterized damage-inducible protein DinB
MGMNVETLRGFFVYNDWARDRLMPYMIDLRDEQLDRPFEMGEGSLRKTMWHIFGAEWSWLQRWKGHAPKHGDCPRDFATMQDLWEQWRKTADERNRFLDTLTDDDLQRPITYTTPLGEQATFKLGHMMMHVCNHGTHHRAQAVNMLRHLGVDPPQMDLLYMYE